MKTPLQVKRLGRVVLLLTLASISITCAAEALRLAQESPVRSNVSQEDAGHDPSPSPMIIKVLPPATPPRNAMLEWVQAWGPALTFLGVFITAYYTLRRGRMDARYSYASEILKFRLRQMEEFYAPALLYIEQSRKVYEKLRWTIEHERSTIDVSKFRLLDYIFEFKNDKTFGPLVERILSIGAQLTALIAAKSGLIEGGITPTFIEYQAHFEILRAASEQKLTDEQKEGWHHLGYYPRMLNREIREGYKVVLEHLDHFTGAGDKIIGSLLNQEVGNAGKLRRQLIENLSFYEGRAKSYADKFDKFDLSAQRQRFLSTLGNSYNPDKNTGGPRKRILDAGCGTGRDTLEFISSGCTVVAIDASPAMLRECTKKIRAAREQSESLPATQAAIESETVEMTFDEIPFRSEFDGVWAAASLLHVPREQMLLVLQRLMCALKPSGVLYLSFKYGRGEQEYDARTFTYFGRREISSLLNRVSGVKTTAIWLSDGKGLPVCSRTQKLCWLLEYFRQYDRSFWLNVLVRKS